MKLENLIKYLTNDENLEMLLSANGLSSESEALLIYMKNSLDIDSEIELLPIEETNDDIIFVKDGINYFQVFPVDYAINLINFDLNLSGRGFSDIQIAQRLFEFRVFDA